MTTILVIAALSLAVIALSVILTRRNHEMTLTKERLVAALKVAKDAKAEVDAAKAAEATARQELDTVTKERDDFKVGHDLVNDAEVQALVDEIIPPVAEEAPVQDGADGSAPNVAGTQPDEGAATNPAANNSAATAGDGQTNTQAGIAPAPANS